MLEYDPECISSGDITVEPAGNAYKNYQANVGNFEFPERGGGGGGLPVFGRVVPVSSPNPEPAVFWAKNI